MSRGRRTAVLIAGAVVVLIGVVLTVISRRWQLVDPPVVPFLVVIAPLMLVAGLALARRVTRRKHRIGVAIGVWWVGTAMGMVVVFGYLSACNTQLDDHAGTTHRVRILDKHRTYRGRQYVDLASWRVPGETESVWLPADVVEHATELHLTIKPGFLGLDWIADVRAAP